MDALNGGTTGAGDDGVTGSTSDRFDQSAIKPSGGSSQGGGMRKRNAAAESEHADAGISTTQKVTRLLAAVDVFPKAEEDIVDHTASGAVVSIVALAIIALLFVSEFVRYLSVHTREHLEVDVTTGTTLPIHFNITFHALRCSQCRMDVMDVSGDQQVNVIQNVHKQRLSSAGAPIGRPVLDSPGLVVTDEGVGEGCVLWGTLLVNRVAGNVHVALGASHHRTTQHIHQFMIADLNSFNASHTITHFSFGEVPASAPASYRDRPHPLNGVTRVAPKADGKMAHFQYFLKIVPTRYVSGHAHDAGAGLAGVAAGVGKGGRAGTAASPRARNGADRAKTNSFQYSVTEHTHLLTPATSNADMDTHKIPGVFFIYDLSAFMIRVESYSVPFSSFFTSVCAIVGGVLTVAGIVDALLFHGSRTLAKSATASAVTGTVLAKLTAAKAGPTTRTV